ncbi:MAG: chemotaxis protein CheA, partial [Oceanospirillaceae bacterium]|nr:chemotaxis protein CheA [Oceanospirillaceae bacterium]
STVTVTEENSVQSAEPDDVRAVSGSGSSADNVPAGVAVSAEDNEPKKAERTLGDVSFLKVDSRKLDHLISLIGEMVTSGAAIELMMRHMTDTRMSEAFSGMVGLVEQVRDGALQLRMVQVGETFSRLRRIVRDVAKETGKGIDLKISGSETELDKTMVDKLGDPLMHIVRNAIDHGIESVEKRLAAGKPESGSLHLNAYHDSGSVVIEVMDDGAGLDADKIYQKALERGLIEQGKKLSEEEVYRLIFSPGFSTAEAVTKLSGRGVGMDVVKRNIDDLKGLIEISSEKGKGTRFRIRLPLTLAIIDSFEVSVRDTHLVIPTSMIKECIGFDRKKLCIDRNFINLRGEVLPFVRVAEIFSYDGVTSANDPVVSGYLDEMLGEEHEQETKEHLVVVQFADKRAGLVVDELLGEVQAVVKPISALFRSIRGISGTTILGTGDVGFIVDVPQFIEFSRDSEAKNINRNLLNVMRT